MEAGLVTHEFDAFFDKDSRVLILGTIDVYKRQEIRRAENAGFCFGVKQAIEKAEKAAEQNPGEIYSMGSLIHNERVTRDLEKRGIRVIESLDEISAPGTVKDVPLRDATPKVIIRSHGAVSYTHLDVYKRQLLRSHLHCWNCNY